MKVFGSHLSPFVRKVHLVAAEKGIAVEAAPAMPRNPSPEFAAASPFRKIPALQDGDYTLADSTAIVTYFDALQPEPPLTPGDARAKGKAIWFEEFADTIAAAAAGKVVFNRFVAPTILGIAGDEDAASAGAAELGKLFDYLESQIPETGWLAGAGFSIGDIAVASVLRTLVYVDVAPDAASHPRTCAWYERVKARPSWQSVAAEEAAAMSGR